MYFQFSFGWCSIHLDNVRLEQGGEGFLLNEQNLLSVTKIICPQSLRRSLTNLAFETQTKLNFSFYNPNSFYIITSSTITDKFTLVRDLSQP